MMYRHHHRHFSYGVITILVIVVTATLYDFGAILLRPLAPYVGWLLPEPAQVQGASMLALLREALGGGLHMLGLLIMLWGVFLLVGAIFACAGPMNFVKGGGLMLIGNYIAGLAN